MKMISLKSKSSNKIMNDMICNATFQSVKYNVNSIIDVANKSFTNIEIVVQKAC